MKGAAVEITALDRFKRTPVDRSYPDFSRSFYSPIDDVHGALKLLIKSAQHSVILSMYGYDDDEFAALIAAHLRNKSMYCQVSLDRSQAGGVHERELLAKYRAEMESNSVAIGTSERGAINHRKMLIIDGLWVIGGSTNWSVSGETKQANELTVTKNAVVAAEARHVLDLTHSAMLTQMAARAAGVAPKGRTTRTVKTRSKTVTP